MRNPAPIVVRTLSTLTSLLVCAAAFGAGDEPASFRAAVRGLDAVAVATLAPLDNDVLLAVYAEPDGLAKRRPAGAWRFAEPLDAHLTPGTSGLWEDLEDGSRLWRLRISSPGATSLNLGLSRFDVPEGARLWLYDGERRLVQGPYTRTDRTPEGGLWTALIPADEAVVELHLPAGAAPADLVIHRVNHGFRPVGGRPDSEPETKQGACQNDVVCSEANPWRNQVRSVAWYTLEGFGTCTGQLVNNAARDGRPYLLSAEHCEITARNASTLVVYWNYESPRCGQLAGGSLRDNQTGATFRASYRPSDFVLVELREKPKASFNVYYTGWNAVNQAPQRAVGIHHPNLDEKAISFNDRRLAADGPTHWEIVWSDGTTEPGSSGSCIFDEDGYCVGTLTGGDSFCWDPRAPDYYGRMSVHWTGGGRSNNSLKPWLDPKGTGVRKLAGMNPSSAGGGNGDGGGGSGGGGGNAATCKPDSTTMCLTGNRFAVTGTWRDSRGQTGAAKVARKLGESGTFFFFAKENWEILVKVLDACDVNGRYWVFTAATTNLEYTLKVRDLKTGRVESYSNRLGQTAATVVDSQAFACV
jgi:hypothetical protein